jgi:hypothetical protein
VFILPLAATSFLLIDPEILQELSPSNDHHARVPFITMI